jgi:N-acetyl sugar amidotransferase
MRIFIDIGHPAHVHYFKNFIKIMETRGHTFFVSARNRTIIHYLLKNFNIQYWDRGKGKNNLFEKIIYMILADYKLFHQAKQFNPDIFVSFASPYAALVSKLIRRPHIALTDTDTARLGILSFAPFTNYIVTPSSFKKSFGKKHIRFDGFMELCYLLPQDFVPNISIFNELGINRNEQYVIIRFVLWGANHDIGQFGFNRESKISFVKKLSSRIRVFISAEGPLPTELESFRIKISPEKMHSVLYFATLYIGEGATMASECAMLGTPSIYVNSLTAGTIEEQVKYGLLFSYRNSNGIFEKAEELLNTPNLKNELNKRRNKMLSEKLNVNDYLIWLIDQYPNSIKILKSNPDYQFKFRTNNYDSQVTDNKKTFVIRTCSRCILDTTVSDIWFDEKGICKYCKIHDEMDLAHSLDDSSGEKINELISKIKSDGRKKVHDCIVGVSGGRDSTYTLYTAVKFGLKPLAVHFDNGWNTEISVKNIKKVCEKLDVPLCTVVADWEEFKDLQISFLKASTPDADVPTDYAIYSVLYDVANKEGIRYILNGHSFRTEGTSPISWTYMDPLYVSSVHKQFGKIKHLKSFPHMTFLKLIWYSFFKGIREVRLMEYINYRQQEVDHILKSELGWEYYGGHHHENMYTKFFQSYYLPLKFNIDKRKTELSALVRSGQITRADALMEIQMTSYKYDPDVVSYTIAKLNLTQVEFDQILNKSVKSHDDYHTYLALMRILRWPIKIAARSKLLPQIMYLKYAQKKS